MKSLLKLIVVLLLTSGVAQAGNGKLKVVLLAGQWSPPRRAHVLAGFFLAVALVSINTAWSVSRRSRSS